MFQWRRMPYLGQELMEETFSAAMWYGEETMKKVFSDHVIMKISAEQVFIDHVGVTKILLVARE
jgi:hypothetical protein